MEGAIGIGDMGTRFMGTRFMGIRYVGIGAGIAPDWIEGYVGITSCPPQE
jgi:hypothetical protein